MSAYAIELDHVTLARGERVVLSDISLSIRSGEFIGVFGSNGAGKTTLLQSILGLVRPRAGRMLVLGATPARGNPSAGYLPQQRASVADLRLRGWDFVASALHGEHWGPPLLSAAARRHVDRVVATVEAETLAARRLCELSGGELQRLLLAQALLGSPKVLLLDEPLLGLDPRFQQAIVALVKRAQQNEGMTVLFTAHELNPLLGAMDRVLYLGGGRASLGSIDEVITGEVLSGLYRTPIDVVHVNGRIVVLSGHGPVEADAHRHHV